MSGARRDPWPELWHALPSPWLALFDPERPWSLLGDPLDAILTQYGEDRIEIALDPRVHLHGSGITIERGTRIAPGATLVGPLYLGREVEIRAGAFLRGGCWVGDHAVVGANVEVKRSIFLPGAQAPHLNYVGDSILGERVNLGAGTILSNFRHDGREIAIRATGGTIPTGRRKLGALVGDRVETGCNSVLHPGTVVGARTRIYPGVQLRNGIWPEDRIIKLRQDVELVPLSPADG